MNMLESAAFRVNEQTSWNVEHAISRNTVFYSQALLKLQNTIQQINVLRYFSNDDKSNLPAGLSYQGLMGMVGREPVRVHTVIPGNSSQFLIQWITDFVMQPVKFAKAVAKTFAVWNNDLRMFAQITFPAIFQHFLTLEYQNLAVEFLEEYIKIAPSRNAGEFLCAFLRSNLLYFEMLWGSYSDMMAERGPGLKSAISFGILLNALKVASVALTDANYRVMRAFASANSKDFALVLIDKFLKQSFFEAHAYKGNDALDEQLISQLSFAAYNPSSPHFMMLYDAMKPTKGTRWVPGQADFSPNLGRVNILLSANDACFIEKIAMENAEMTNLKFTQSFAMPESIRNTFRPIYYEFSMKPFISKDPRQEMCLFGREQMFDLDTSHDCHIRWKILETQLGTLHTRSLHRICPMLDMAEEKQLYEYGMKVMHNRTVEMTEQCENFIDLLAAHDYIDRMRSLIGKELDITLQRFTSLMFVSFKPFESFSDTKSASMTSKNIAPCMAVHRYAHQFRIQNDNQIKDLIDILYNEEKQNVKLAFLNKMELRKSRKSEHLIPIGRHVKRRRTSFEAIQRECFHYKSILSQVLPHCGQSRLCMWVYFKCIDDWHRDDRMLSQLKNQYRELANVEKLVHPGLVHEWKHVVKRVKRCIQRADFVNIHRGASVVVLAGFGVQLMQINEKFFKPVSAEVTTVSSSKMMKLVVQLCDNDSMFEAFLWCEKLFFAFPDLKAMLPSHISVPLSFIRSAMWVIIRELDEDLVTRITEFSQHPF